jgi:hypothetical protein
MADIPASNWSEVDADNDEAAPDGFPEGMAPSGVNNGLRAHQGAIKRFWNKINAVKTTAGTSTAYTLSYDVSPAAYVDGEIISFVVNATNGAAATINVNALGAKALRLFGGNLLPGALLANQIVQARYGSAAGAFDIIPQHGWVRLGEVDASAAATVDFTSIPAGVNHLQCVAELRPGTNAVTIQLQTYGADGVLDTGSSDYVDVGIQIQGTSAPTPYNGTTGQSFIRLSGISNVGNTAQGFSCQFTAANIQAATQTKFIIGSTYLNSAVTDDLVFSGSGRRAEADRITGIRIAPSSGTFTGKVTLMASA